MAYSTIPAAKSQLLTTLQARPGLSGVLIGWGLPAMLPGENERVFINDVVGVTREWAAMGQLRIDESYTIHIIVEVFQSGDNQRACEERMWAIVAEVEQAAVMDITLAGILNWGARPGAMDPRVAAVDDGWLSFVTLNLDCSARIQAS